MSGRHRLPVGNTSSPTVDVRAASSFAATAPLGGFAIESMPPRSAPARIRLDASATVFRMERHDGSSPKPDLDGAVDPASAPVARRRRTTGPGHGDTIGGALVGFDYQVFRATKPPAILVESAKPVRGLSGEGGSMLSIDFPDATADGDEAAEPGAARGTGLR